MLEVMISVQHCEAKILVPLLAAQSHFLGGRSLEFIPFGASFANNNLLLKYLY